MNNKGLIRAGDIIEQSFSSSSVTPQETPNVEPPAKPTEFANAQLSLFQNVLCNTAEERERFSNAIDLWDSVPRYFVSRQAQAKARENGKFLENHTAVFQHCDRTYTVTISPARVNDLDDNQRDYYPSTTEELVEERSGNSPSISTPASLTNPVSAAAWCSQSTNFAKNSRGTATRILIRRSFSHSTSFPNP